MTDTLVFLGCLVAVVAFVALVAGFVRAMLLDRLGGRPVWPSKPARRFYLPAEVYEATSGFPPVVPGPARVTEVTVTDLPRGEIGGAR